MTTKRKERPVSFEDWESGKVTLTDEEFVPEWLWHPLTGWKVVGFIGKETGMKLSGEFQDVLEWERRKR